jgi:hypothetical protein
MGLFMSTTYSNSPESEKLTKLTPSLTFALFVPIVMQ